VAAALAQAGHACMWRDICMCMSCDVERTSVIQQRLNGSQLPKHAGLRTCGVAAVVRTSPMTLLTHPTRDHLLQGPAA
jgi:hypothetical protein